MSRQALLVSVLSALAFGGGAILPLAAPAAPHPQPSAAAVAPVATGTHVRWSGVVLGSTSTAQRQCFVMEGAALGAGFKPSPGPTNPGRFVACQDFHSPVKIVPGLVMTFTGTVDGTAGLEVENRTDTYPLVRADLSYVFGTRSPAAQFGIPREGTGSWNWTGGVGQNSRPWATR